jgi:hypothetical protein
VENNFERDGKMIFNFKWILKDLEAGCFLLLQIIH